MTDSYEQRVGQNEAMLRDVNERIAAGRWPGDEAEPIAFRCECSALGCNQMVELTRADYEQVRAEARRFLLVPGHEIAGVEVVVRREPGYVIVEKVGAAGRVAERADPRED